MSAMRKTHVIKEEDIHGSWSLVRTFLQVQGEEAPHAFGQGSYGHIHYLPDGRMAVLLAHDGHKRLSGDRRTSPDGETAASARHFDAYGGTFSIEGDVITHHLDICSFENDRGADYIRHAALAGDRLTLRAPEFQTPGGRGSICLEWERVRRTAPPSDALG